jgi:hypothetical protein
MEYLRGLFIYPQNPYGTLPLIWSFASDEEVAAKEGSVAMRAYNRMIFSKDIDEKEGVKSLLIQYCKPDTKAMIIISKHLMGYLG